MATSYVKYKVHNNTKHPITDHMWKQGEVRKSGQDHNWLLKQYKQHMMEPQDVPMQLTFWK